MAGVSGYAVQGFADFAFIPRLNAGYRPAMVVELKYNKSAETAIKQIKDKKYHGALSGYSDKILLVGISYDTDGKNKKKHTKYKTCESKVQELISTEQLVSLCNLKAEIERKENRQNRRKEKEKHK